MRMIGQKAEKQGGASGREARLAADGKTVCAADARCSFSLQEARAADTETAIGGKTVCAAQPEEAGCAQEDGRTQEAGCAQGAAQAAGRGAKGGADALFADRRLERAVCAAAVVLLSLVAVLPFACSATFGGHDFPYHLDSILALNEAWENGTFTSKIYSLICSDYGYGTGLFYSALPAGATVLFMRAFGLDVAGAAALFYFFLFALGGLCMYGFCLRVFKKSSIALPCALFYVLFPYYLTNLYVRFAFSESVMTLVLPLVLWGIYELVERRSYVRFLLLFTTGYSLGVLSHLTLTMYLTFFVAAYICLNFKKFFSRGAWIPFLLSAGLVLLITAGFTVPMLCNIGATRADSLSRTGISIWATSLDLFRSGDLLPSTVLLLLLYVLFCFVHLKRDKAARRPFRKYFWLFTGTLLLATPAFPWVALGFAPFNMIQFSWRLLAIDGAVSVFMFGYVLKYADRALWRRLALAGAALLAAAAFVLRAVCFPVAGHVEYDRSALSADYVSHYEGLGGSKSGDYFPSIGVWDYYEYTSTRVNAAAVLEADTEVLEFSHYPSRSQVVFLVKDAAHGFVTLNIPYAAAQGCAYSVNRTRYPNTSVQPQVRGALAEGEEYLRIELSGVQGEALVVIDYSQNAALGEYLEEHPFAFVVKSGEAAFSKFVKQNTFTYSVEIAAEEGAVVELPTLYYKGYELIWEENGQRTALKPVHGENGFIEAAVQGSGTLYVRFAPAYITAANAVSVAGTVLFAAACAGVPLFLRRKTRGARRESDERTDEHV